MDVVIHESAIVSEGANIGAGTRIWHGAQVREGAVIGANCIIGKNVYVDFDVRLGNNVKLQNNSSLYHPLVIEDGVFVGPHVVFTNDRVPRAVTPEGTLKSAEDWQPLQTRVCYGASIGAGAVVLPGITIGQWALIGAGSIVLRDVGTREIVVGNPARAIGHACDCGARLTLEGTIHRCPQCDRLFDSVAWDEA